jgi:hypothetical protein
VKQKFLFLFFCTVFAVGSAFSQKVNSKSSNLLFVKFVQKPVNTGFLFNNPNFTQPAKDILPGDYYTTQIGFFCRQEIKFEKITKIPFRFRLGSVEACDRLEGKGR